MKWHCLIPMKGMEEEIKRGKAKSSPQDKIGVGIGWRLDSIGHWDGSKYKQCYKSWTCD